MKLALFQCSPQVDGISTALTRLDDAARRAAGHAVDILLTPEMYLTGYAIGVEAVQAAALSPSGPSMAEVADIAKRHRVGILIGFPERDEDGKIYNAIQLFDRKGQAHIIYRKTHLWGDIDRSQFSAGQRLSKIIELDGWNLGFAICYDIEFPELARVLALEDADVVLVSTASMKPYESIATQVVPARAEENEIYVAYCNYTGAEGSIEYYGLSTVAGPDGKIVAQAGGDEDLLIAQLDRDHLDRWRKDNDHLSGRRPALYKPLME